MEGEERIIHIRLHVYDMDIPVNVVQDEEPFYRNAAKLITDTVNRYAEHYISSKSMKEILYMAMIDIALNHEFLKERNDTKPYEDILKTLTAEIESTLGEKS
ncbi:MAG: cell division protein ZapA [Prevotella sp.]|nr:cell division protein ZapA [Prevotella sp.]